MIRLYDLTVDTGSKDPEAVAATVQQRLHDVSRNHPALLGCHVTHIPATVVATLRVKGSNRWDCSAKARSIATSILLRIGVKPSDAQLQALPAPPDGRSLKPHSPNAPK